MIPVLVTVVEADLPLRVRRREDLGVEPQVAVVLGDAPDGLPLVLRVERRASVEAAVRTALGHPASMDGEIARALDALEAAVASSARSAGVFELRDEARGMRLYRTHATVGALLGESMLARILGAQSPLILPEDRFAPSSRPERVTNTAVLAAVSRASAPVTLMKGLATKRHVGVPLRPGPAFLVEEGDKVEPETLEPLRFEDLRPVPSARFHARGRREQDGALGDVDAYRRAVMENPSVGWSVAAGDVGTMIVQLARSLAPVHDEGRVHADVKPANTVITANGAVAIDPIGVTVGQVSPGATPGWAAPEQILARAVVPSTDVYPLGLMVARLLGAAIYGEERSFLVPIGKGECRRVRMLADQDVFVDPESTGPMSRAVREEWQDFVRQCVEFDPDDRPQDVGGFASRLEELLGAEPLQWRLPLPGGPGTLRRDVDVLGAMQPSWVVSDFR
ncbi:MAG: hypothetical protein H6709_18660 [Kofleriaceae bacterium]|nr:hypothetical protein [Myxococcales bacterium]MCB9574110.1 hypothetical protein [Kofleriaceae bacterium]